MIIGVHIGIVLLVVLGVAILITTKNVVHAAYALALVLIGLAGVYVGMDAEFLAVVQILLYAGGVVILLSFGVMMTTRAEDGKVTSKTGGYFFGGIISLSLFVLLVYLISSYNWAEEPIERGYQMEDIGVSLLTDHLVAFELVAFILLVVLVAASYLAKMSSNE